MTISNSKFKQCIYFTSNALARKTEKLAVSIWKKIDLGPSHGYLLILVLEKPGIKPKEISMELDLEPSTITRLIEKLEIKKLVVRVSEGKTTNVYPTTKSKELLPKIQQCVAEFDSKYAAMLGKEECAKLVQNMAKSADKITF